MAESLKFRIFDLLAEFPAHAFCVFAALEHAWTVSSGAPQTVLYSLDGFCIWIEGYFHAAIIPHQLKGLKSWVLKLSAKGFALI